MKFVNVGPHSWACLGSGEDPLHSYGANQGFITGEEACLVVDSGFHNRTALQVLGRVKKHHPKQLLLVDTHYHSDHVFGNSQFTKDGAVVVSHEKCRSRMQHSSPKLLTKYRARDPRLTRLLRGVDISLPSVTYRDQLSFYLDDETIAEIVHPRIRAHTDGDSMIHLPTENVVFAGDILWVGYHPNLEDSNIQGQVQALKMILQWHPRKIVPGHGPVAGTNQVRTLIRYLEQLDSNLNTLTKEQLSLEDYTRRAIPYWTRNWKLRRLAESNVQKAWTRTRKVKKT